MRIEEAKLYLEHTSKDDFNLEEWQKKNRYQAIQVILKEIERLNNIIKEVREYIDKYSRYCSNKEYFSTRNPITDLKIILDKEVN